MANNLRSSDTLDKRPPGRGLGKTPTGPTRPHPVPKGNGKTPGALSAAKKELKKQHPHGVNERGPFHSDMSHVRHERLGGFKPVGGRGGSY